VAKRFSGRRFFAASLAGAASIVTFPSGACLRTETLFAARDSHLAGSFPTRKKTNLQKSRAAGCFGTCKRRLRPLRSWRASRQRLEPSLTQNLLRSSSYGASAIGKRSRHSEASADSAGVICCAAKASGNGHGGYFGDGFGDGEDPHGGFLFGGRLAAYGSGNVPFWERVRIDPHDALHDETQWEEDHREGVERPRVPELARERPPSLRKSWSE
jgi:hypothetical protein